MTRHGPEEVGLPAATNRLADRIQTAMNRFQCSSNEHWRAAEPRATPTSLVGTGPRIRLQPTAQVRQHCDLDKRRRSRTTSAGGDGGGRALVTGAPASVRVSPRGIRPLSWPGQRWTIVVPEQCPLCRFERRGESTSPAGSCCIGQRESAAKPTYANEESLTRDRLAPNPRHLDLYGVLRVFEGSRLAHRRPLDLRFLCPVERRAHRCGARRESRPCIIGRVGVPELVGGTIGPCSPPRASRPTQTRCRVARQPESHFVHRPCEADGPPAARPRWCASSRASSWTRSRCWLDRTNS